MEEKKKNKPYEVEVFDKAIEEAKEEYNKNPCREKMFTVNALMGTRARMDGGTEEIKTKVVGWGKEDAERIRRRWLNRKK